MNAVRNRFWEAVTALDRGESVRLAEILQEEPNVVYYRPEESENAYLRAYFQRPTLLHFIAENPTRTGRIAANIVEMVDIMLKAGAEVNAACGTSLDHTTLALVASGKVARESGVQVDLIRFLVAHGADTQAAMQQALLHLEMEAARALVECGHPMDLISCVGIDRLTELEQFAAEADYELLGKALAIAAVLGKSEATRILIRHGADVQRFNPAGFHGHTTALHQAIWHGHVETARILLEAGASTAVLDTVYKGTPLDWAKYAKRPECEALLAEFS